MSFIAAQIGRYRRMLRSEVPTVTRRSIEWLLVNALREEAGLEPDIDTGEDDLGAPALVQIAGQAVAEAMRAQGAQFGAFQIYLAKQDVLVVLASRNHAHELVDPHAFVRPDGRSVSSRALLSARRVIVEDVESDAAFAPFLPFARAEGFRAMQSTPVKDKSGRVLAILSTQFASPRAFSPDELARMDAHAEAIAGEIAREWA